MDGIKKLLDLSNHPLSKSSWAFSAPWASLFFEVGDLTKLLPQLGRLLGEKPGLFGQWSTRWFAARGCLETEGAQTLPGLIFTLLVF